MIRGGAVQGTIYFVRSAGLIKIGFSRRWERRHRSLTFALPEVEVLGTHPGPRSDETRLHKIFWNQRVNGEWFKQSEKLLEVAKTGLTDALREYLRTTGREHLPMKLRTVTIEQPWPYLRPASSETGLLA